MKVHVSTQKIVAYNGCVRQQVHAMHSIVEWFQNQSVFITGGSGFIGKALIFKLLQCGVPRIYVLIRTKRGMNPEERLDNIIKHEIFDSLREKDERIRTRLEAIPGDTTLPGLDLAQEHLDIIYNKVTIIFHVAASVKFDDPLRQAVFSNLRPTRDIVEIGKRTKNLQMLHFVSTAYSNSDKMEPHPIEERIYESKIDPKKLIKFVEQANDDEINAITLKVMGASFNSYVFTKHLSESVVAEAATHIPVVISRPPVVLSAKTEPYPGWLDNISSPAAVCAGAGKGVLRVCCGTKHTPKSYIPVDTCVNFMMVASWKQANIQMDGCNDVVYNMDSIPVTSQELKDAGMSVIYSHPPHGAIWYPRLCLINNRHLFLFMFIILHLLSGAFIDGILRIRGAKPRLLKIYRVLFNALTALHPLVNVFDKFVVEKHIQLQLDIPVDERDLFPIEISKSRSEFHRMVQNASLGLRKLMKEPLTTLKEDAKRITWLWWVDKIFIALLMTIAYKILPIGYFIRPVIVIFNYFLVLFQEVGTIINENPVNIQAQHLYKL